MGGKRLATSEREEEDLTEAEERLERPEAKKRKNSES